MDSRFRAALFPAVPVPFDRRGKFDTAAQESYARHLSGQPIDGVAVWAHTGRGLLIDPEVGDAVLESWRAALGAQRLLIAGAGAPAAAPGKHPDGAAEPAPGQSDLRGRIDAAARMAERARRGGADAILAHPPGFLRGRADRKRWIREYHEAIAGAGAPVIAFYLYAEAGGVDFTPDELGEILSIPGVAAIKIATLDSVCLYQDLTSRIEKQFPRIAILTGEDRFLGYSLLRGACGALIGMGAALPGFQKRLVMASQDRPGQEFIRLSRLADRFAECTFVKPFEGYIQRMLHALAVLRAIPREAAFDPWHHPLPEDEKAAIEAFIESIGAEAGHRTEDG